MKKLPLSKTHPELAKEWHPTKNDNLTADDVTAGSGKKVYSESDSAFNNIGENFAKSRWK